MRRWGISGLSMTLLALGAGVGAEAAEAHPARHGLPVPTAPQVRPHLVIVEDNGGFVIRCETPRRLRDPDSPRGAIPPLAIPLGTSVRIDRSALQHSNQKDNDHGEIR